VTAPPLIDARRVSKRFLLRHGTSAELKVKVLDRLLRRRTWVEEFWALRNLSVTIGPGESLGLVGRNGSGKSTLLKLIAGLHRPTSGQLLVQRDLRLGTMIELGVGFHGELTGRENVYLNASLYGFSRDAIAEKYPAIVDYAELGHFMDVPLKTYSSGMQMRLGFAVAAILDPDVLLIDEVFAVGDQDFQVKCIATLKAFQSAGGTLLFVSHAPSAVRALCDRACVLDRGELLFDGPTEEGLAHYERHVMTNLVAADVPSDEGDGAPVSVGSLEAGQRADPAARWSEDDLAMAWHRLRHGAHWAATGQWCADLLRREGLQPEHFVLDVGCGSLGLGRLLLPYLAQSRYWGYEPDRDLLFDGIAIELTRAGIDPVRGHFIINRTFDFTECPHRFESAIASSLFSRLPLHGVARCLAAVLPKLADGGRFFATVYEGPVDADVRRPDGPWTKTDGAPYHHDFGMLEGIAGSLGARMARVDAPAHPRGESLVVFTCD
jgi:ABC-type polysaccharide/polyol phosphate transport system ATPase subunit